MVTTPYRLCILKMFFMSLRVVDVLKSNGKLDNDLTEKVLNYINENQFVDFVCHNS